MINFNYNIRFLLFIAAFLTIGELFAQCPPSAASYSLKNQTEIDTFLINYPNCTELDGTLSIWGVSSPEITNLDAFINITKVKGNLRIRDAEELTSLSGLDNLQRVEGEIELRDLISLQNLSSLEQLDSIGVFQLLNVGITSCQGLDGLTHSLDTELRFNHCDLLTNMEGLAHITELKDLTVSYNDILTSLDGFDNLTTIHRNLYVVYNDALTAFNLHNLEQTNYLTLEYNDVLNNFSGLQNLTTIESGLRITQNPQFLNFSGLTNLTTIGNNIYLVENESLINFEGLDNLTTVGGEFRVDENPSLESFVGLNNLTTLHDILRIRYNDNLVSLNGFENLVNAYNLTLSQNSSLSDISALSNVSFWESVWISNNPQLSVCAIPGICNYLVDYTGNSTPINSNAPGCYTKDEVLLNCNGNAKLNYPIFYDINENMLLDSDEPLLSIGQFILDPGNLNLFGNSINAGSKYLNWGNYAVEYESDPNWNATTSTSFSFTLDSLNPVETILVGLKPDELISDIETVIAPALIRCNEYVTFDIVIWNNGTTIADGIVWFDFDNRITDTVFLDTPDYLEPNRVGWDFEQLAPSHTLIKQIQLQIPGPPVLPIGDSIYVSNEIFFNDPNGQDQHVSSSVAYEVECAYDPNDKLVQPSYPENYALFEEDLIYTVRFQNTGNAEAYNVVVEDEIDVNLDISTFKVIASSHEAVLNTYIEARKVSFDFKNIFLPDSTTNFDASQGYVMYRITPMSDIEEFTIVENTADIYFDFNPAIVTNTTQNNIVYSFDHDEDESLIWEDCDDFNATINPTATEIPGNNIDEDCDGEDLPTSILAINENEIRIYPNPFERSILLEQTKVSQLSYEITDVTGKVFYTGNFEKDRKEIPLNILADGVYFIKIKDTITNLFTVEKIVKFSGN